MSTTMDDATTARGACLCGAVRFEVTLPAAFCAHCHCSMCRRAHGAAYVTWFSVERSGMQFLTGEEDVVRFASSSHGVRSFCGTCGSTMFCELDEHPGRVDIVLANMEDDIGLEPQLHAWFDHRASWTRADDGLPRLGGEGGLEPIDGSDGTGS